MDEIDEMGMFWRRIKTHLTSLWLWRDTTAFDVLVGSTKKARINLPLRPALVFLVAIVLVENVNLIPSAFLFGVAWLFLASSHQHSDGKEKDRSFWNHPKPYRVWLRAFLSNDTLPVNVPPLSDSDVKGIPEEDTAMGSHPGPLGLSTSRDMNQPERSNIMDAGSNAGVSSESQRRGSLDGSVVSGFSGMRVKSSRSASLVALANTLLPVQTALGRICEAKRVAVSIVCWDESHVAFFITTVAIVAGIAFLFVPWAIVLVWTLRITVWSLLGPWMWLVDRFLVQDRSIATARYRSWDQHEPKEESEVRVAAWREYLFGKHHVVVPSWRPYRYCDSPLPSSAAVPISKEDKPECFISKKKHGQKLCGRMVPVWDDDTGKPVID